MLELLDQVTGEMKRRGTSRSASRVAAPWRRVYRPLLLFGFAATIMCFVVASQVVRHHYRTITRPWRRIAYNALPSLAHLDALRSDVHSVERGLDQEAGGGVAPRPALHRELMAVEDAAATYLSTALPEEREAWDGTVAKTLEDVVGRDREALEDPLLKEGSTEMRGVASGAAEDARRLDDALARMDDLTASDGRAAADRMEKLRAEFMRTTDGLQAASVGFSLLVVGVVFAAVRRYARSAEERANELEQFACRVAHDIRGPLAPVLLSLHLGLKGDIDEQTRRTLQRGLRSGRIVSDIVGALFEFASGGAHPFPGATASVRHVLDDVLEEVRPIAAANNTVVQVNAFEDPIVACDGGILASMLSNLLRNAIKFMAARPERRVVVTIACCRGRVHVEVEDTGPGLTPGTERSIFEPYARGGTTVVPGLGLGLATVKRLAEAHGGAVGVRHVPNAGSTFWFELPEARKEGGPGQRLRTIRHA